ncbi:MAG: VPLPA-CTERM sorting domain-containing protein [Sedimentitalea sp.]|uniref:VPLPA-CTERM sorting domain-containing protein n=1 Tax=Sedimentitalea sp. TaxID=2048915 RepID=UPI0032633F90
MMLATAGIAHASTFTIGSGSSVSLTPTGGFFSGCTGAGDCIEESLASGLVGTTFDLNEVGDYETFDFLTFTGNGTGFYENYTASATLAFSAPTIDASSGGAGGVVGVIGGFIGAGALEWDDVPVDVAFGNTGIVSIDFQGGSTILPGTSITTTATVTLVQADISPVPLPATGLLLLGGMGGLVAMRRKRKAA